MKYIYMNIFNILILMSIVDAIILIINSIIIKEINITSYIFIQYSTKILGVLCIYLYFMSEEEKKQIFTLKYKKLWLLSFILSLIGIITYYYYYKIINHLGPSRTHSIYQSFKILIILLISTLILKNNKLNIKLITGIFFILLGMYILKDYKKYV
jgi:drug/metabolite transporter (DMT)-like permease